MILVKKSYKAFHIQIVVLNKIKKFKTMGTMVLLLLALNLLSPAETANLDNSETPQATTNIQSMDLDGF